jgi:hypothetical protein
MPANSEDERLNAHLNAVDSFLLSKETSVSDDTAYNECPERHHLELQALKGDETSKVINAAESVFQFFLPLRFEGPTALKYWGAIYQLLKVWFLGPLQPHPRK